MIKFIKKILKSRLFFILITMAIITGLSYYLFSITGLASIDELKDFIMSAGYFAIFVYIILYVLQTMFLQFIPATGSMLIIVSVAVFGSFLGTVISAIAVFATSITMYLIGRSIKKKTAISVLNISNEDFEKATSIVNSTTSKIAYPMMMLFPMFPDDVLCVVAGMARLKFKQFLLLTLPARAIGVISFVYLGGEFIKLSLIEMIIVVNLIIIDVYLLMKNKEKIEGLIKRVSQKLRKKSDIKQNTAFDIENKNDKEKVNEDI